jgi:hypothetical protein
MYQKDYIKGHTTMLSRNQTNKFHILGLDPGSVNFAYSIIEVEIYSNSKGTTLVADTKETGIVKNPVASMRNSKFELRDFLTDLDFIVNRKGLNIQGIVLEQFQARGVQTSLLEKVNVMIGGILTQFYHLDIDFFSASAWKRSVKKVFDLDEEYKVITCTPHELDATLIGLYGAFKLLKIDPFYGYRASHFKKVCRKVEKVSKTERRKRKVKKG